MKLISPEGGVYQAGTLSGNPIAMAAGIATLKLLSAKGPYQKLFQKTHRLAQGLIEIASSAKFPLQAPHTCGMLSVFFSKKPVKNLKDVQASRTELYGRFFHEMLKRGIYLPPSPFEAWFLSLAHGENEIAKTLRAAKDSFNAIRLEI